MKPRQQGSTLLVSMIILVAITLLVVFSIRSGNTNLRIAGNTQVQTETHQAIQQAIEQTLEEVVAVENPSLMPARTVDVSVGGASYAVNVKAMNNCRLELQVKNDELNPDVANDVACFAGQDPDRAVLANGTLSTFPSECKTQHWEVQASIDDALTGAKAEQVQGIAVRVPSTVSCL